MQRVATFAVCLFFVLHLSFIGSTQRSKPNVPEPEIKDVPESEIRTNVPECGPQERNIIKEHEHSVGFFCCLEYNLCAHFSRAWKMARKQITSGELVIPNRENRTADLAWLKLNCENKCEVNQYNGKVKAEVLPVIHLYRREVSIHEPYTWLPFEVQEIKQWGRAYWKNDTEVLKGAAIEKSQKKIKSSISKFLRGWCSKEENKYFLKFIFWVLRINRMTSLATALRDTADHLCVASMLMPSNGMHIFFYVFLAKEIYRQRSAEGLSASSILMQAVPGVLRMCFLHKYDVCSASDIETLALLADAYTCLMLFHLWYCITLVSKETYQKEYDSCNVVWLVLGCISVAVFIHIDVDQGLVCNIVWTAALYIENLAMVPQLCMLKRCGGMDKTLIANDVVGVGIISRIVNLMLLARYFYVDLIGTVSFGFPAWAIVVLSLVQILIICELIEFVQ
eukprot:gnl/MRDRNA2_/MRDRNA2_169884_c0_seq1.p1 gnl/MRDRNA2_/MRDRNA2_169884_c0~~gnl/MRDRNA2_/MRDRNA2_169884_c0_seq1.p1  ORF type:complete len:451 (+),score=39.94 gnl/MRDRNA2_/MRDRNA2_169884_c0_seq1:129-1481(+)